MQAAASAPLLALAPAKINLTLHVLGRRPDGYHDLESLVVFAGIGDRLALCPGEPLSLHVRGPTAGSAGPTEDNLILRAVRALAARRPGLAMGRFVLDKRLPVAAGIGGGSSDAAAALRLVARLNGLAADDSDVVAAAGATGADIPVCLVARASMMRGTGTHVSPLAAGFRWPCVLVNPRVAVPTPAVFKALAFDPARRDPEGADPRDVGAARALAQTGRNDLQAPALTVAPAIGEALDALARTPRVELARMSGSGATCFALYPSCRAAADAAKILRAAHPGWWVRSTVVM
jgi:4-diphosphocytidyl-2-C-methyl-D-erythritol kinase